MQCLREERALQMLGRDCKGSIVLCCFDKPHGPQTLAAGAFGFMQTRNSLFHSVDAWGVPGRIIHALLSEMLLYVVPQ